MAERACVRCEQPATVPPVYPAQNVLRAALAAGDTAELACAACLCDVLREEATQMACEHAFCDSCWRQHLSVQISEGRSRRLMCMGVRCGAVCDEEQARSLMAARLRRYSQSCSDAQMLDVLVAGSGGQPLAAADALRFHTLYLSSPRFVTTVLAPFQYFRLLYNLCASQQGMLARRVLDSCPTHIGSDAPSHGSQGITWSAICAEMVPQVCRLLAGEARLLAKYERSLLESYVEDNAMTRWCPRCAFPQMSRVRLNPRH